MSFKRFEIPPRFHDLPMGMRRASLCADLTSENVLKTLLGRHDLDDKAYDFIDRSIDAMIENAIGTHPMPLGVVPNFCVDGTMHAVAMATEEPSVIAGFNRVSRVFNASGGTLTSMPMPMTAAQIAIAISPQNASHLLENLQSRVDDWRTIANDANPALVAAGGGVVQIDFEMIATAESARCHCTTDACFATLAEFDPIEPINEVLVVATRIDTRCHGSKRRQCNGRSIAKRMVRALWKDGWLCAVYGNRLESRRRTKCACSSIDSRASYRTVYEARFRRLFATNRSRHALCQRKPRTRCDA